jgi:hypothetical protein
MELHRPPTIPTNHKCQGRPEIFITCASDTVFSSVVFGEHTFDNLISYMRTDELTRTLENLFGELMHGVSGKGGFMLNVGDRGLLRSLERLSASEASAATRTGSSIAAHVAHVAYGLSLMNRWSQGENSFTTADWAASWKKTVVTEPEWEALRIQLRDEGAKWLVVLRTPREVAGIELSGMVGSIAHLAYHVGAIRQINANTRGPAEGER